ncbi:uncharacterized protein N7515_005237 [Penicillium bovifimosum]|uniref:Uncharacterized protein n=1 Tax=Penicillium bovifimosum TaxID=126998 RepID=A0A9W9KYK8_9EURO|nr:uncharacterized protein N7515_005237 [Penicillium bovifimosum]KAJ5129198.1 hypothetical protein N7515_005237 [Penicillium bovifimosum]
MLLETIRKLEKEQTELRRDLNKPSSPKKGVKDLDYGHQIADLPRLKRSSSVQERDTWLNGLELIFEGCPNRFSKDENKIITAVMQTSDSCRKSWYQHLAGLSEEKKHHVKHNWPAFVDWTLMLISNSEQRLGDLQIELENKVQDKNQDPVDFDQELAVLEGYFEQRSEKEKALKSPPMQLSFPTPGLKWCKLLCIIGGRTVGTLIRRGNVSDEDDDEDKPRRFKGKGRSFANRNKEKREKSPKKNPVGPNGKVNTCNFCHSEFHYASRCPDKKKSKGKEKGKKDTPVQGAKSAGKEDELE